LRSGARGHPGRHWIRWRRRARGPPRFPPFGQIRPGQVSKYVVYGPHPRNGRERGPAKGPDPFLSRFLLATFLGGARLFFNGPQQFFPLHRKLGPVRAGFGEYHPKVPPLARRTVSGVDGGVDGLSSRRCGRGSSQPQLRIRPGLSKCRRRMVANVPGIETPGSRDPRLGRLTAHPMQPSAHLGQCRPGCTGEIPIFLRGFFPLFKAWTSLLKRGIVRSVLQSSGGGEQPFVAGQNY